MKNIQVESIERDKVKEFGQDTIKFELTSLSKLSEYIDKHFEDAILTILNSSGRIVLTGIGKSAIIAQKITATLNSTGQPALFMHAADAIHGDLGMVQENDIVIAISKSGNTPEIVALTPLLKRFGNTLIAIVGNLNSTLAQSADFVLNTTIDKEACPNNLAPTTSTTAQLIMGDAIAVTLLKMRNFSGDDFSKYHPGGALGKQLYMRCNDIVVKHSRPSVSLNTHWKDVIINITENRLGATVVTNNDKIEGIVTDGDIRRMLYNNTSFDKILAENIMTPNPITIQHDELAAEAAKIMQEKRISQLIVVNKSNDYLGIIHIHDLYAEGII